MTANATPVDRTGQLVVGAPRGRQRWGDGSDLIKSLGAAGVYLSNHIIGSARLTDADTAGIYGIGTAYKAASAAAAAEPVLTFPVAGSIIPDGQKWIIGAVLTVNGTAVPSGTAIKLGFYPFTVGGSSGTIAYTLSATGAIFETYSTGLPASALTATPNPDRRADFVTGGNQVYALGVEIGTALPAGCVVDVSLSLQLS
jgi:hypothetical protein